MFRGVKSCVKVEETIHNVNTILYDLFLVDVRRISKIKCLFLSLNGIILFNKLIDAEKPYQPLTCDKKFLF